MQFRQLGGFKLLVQEPTTLHSTGNTCAAGRFAFTYIVVVAPVCGKWTGFGGHKRAVRAALVFVRLRRLFPLLSDDLQHCRPALAGCLLGSLRCATTWCDMTWHWCVARACKPKSEAAAA